MTFDYNKEEKQAVSLVLENGTKVEGEFIDLRISTETLPAGKQWYQVRHCDDDWGEPASLKRGCVTVNFYGTVICDPIEDMDEGAELDIQSWDIED